MGIRIIGLRALNNIFIILANCSRKAQVKRGLAKTLVKHEPA